MNTEIRKGSDDGELYAPHDIAIAPDGSVYVADYANHRIQKFTSTGSFTGKWGSYGDGDGQFDEPYGIAIAPDGSIYVTDRGNHRIQKMAGIPSILQITTPSFPQGQIGSYYQATLTATRGTPSYTWSIIAGSLPSGLALNSNTGIISGTPTMAGSSNFTVQVQDSSNPVQTSSKNLSIKIVGLTAIIVTGKGGKWFSHAYIG